MAIQREELSRMNLDEVIDAGAGKIPISTPGDILLHEFMEHFRLSANALAKALDVPTNRITAIINGARGITADTAFRLACYFGTTPQFWLGLQADYDLRILNREEIVRKIRPLAA